MLMQVQTVVIYQSEAKALVESRAPVAACSDATLVISCIPNACNILADQSEVSQIAVSPSCFADMADMAVQQQPVGQALCLEGCIEGKACPSWHPHQPACSPSSLL